MRTEWVGDQCGFSVSMQQLVDQALLRHASERRELRRAAVNDKLALVLLRKRDSLIPLSPPLSQAAFARLLGVDPGTLSRWERGHRIPAGKYAQAAEAFLGWPRISR